MTDQPARSVEFFKRHFWISLVIIFVILVLFIFAWSFLRAPAFPESIPSYEQVKDDLAMKQSQTDLFNRFTKYIRDNHGGLLYAEELTEYESLYLDKKPELKTFVHKYRIFDRDKIFELIRAFSSRDETEINVYDSCVEEDEAIKCYQLDFVKDERLAVRVYLEYDNGDETTALEFSATDTETPTAIDPEYSNSHKNPLLAIVIDDCGQRMDIFYDLISLDYDLTYSILPQLPYSEESAIIAKNAGNDIMLHLPMQPKDWPEFDPGLGALMVDDSDEILEMKISVNLDTVPGVIGVNNHMGSEFTTYAEGLDVVMRVLREYSLFFLDSKTAPGHTAKNSAAKFNVPYMSRDIFLDNIKTVDAIKNQLFKAARMAEKRGRVIAIGHCTHNVTYQALAEGLPEIESQGITIAGISAFVEQAPAVH